MPDKRTISLARNWAGWVGEQLAAQEMGVSVETLNGWLKPVSAPASTPKKTKQTPTQTNQKPTQAPTQAPTRPDQIADQDEPAVVSKVKRYTAEQKAEALRLVREIGLSKAARETGVSVQSLIKWRQAIECIE